MCEQPDKIILVVFERIKGSHTGRRHIVPYLTREEFEEEKRKLDQDYDPFQKIIAEGVSRELALKLCAEAKVTDLCLVTSKKKRRKRNK